MKKVIKLTESDLARIVKRVIKENDDYTLYPSDSWYSGNIKKGPYRIHQWGPDSWFDETDSSVSPDEIEDFEEEVEFGPDDFGKFIEYTRSIPNRWDTARSTQLGKDYYDRHYKQKNPVPIKIRKLRGF